MEGQDKAIAELHLGVFREENFSNRILVPENSNLLGHCAVLAGEYVRTFRMIVMPSKRQGVYTQRDGTNSNACPFGPI